MIEILGIRVNYSAHFFDEIPLRLFKPLARIGTISNYINLQLIINHLTTQIQMLQASGKGNQSQLAAQSVCE